MNWRRWDNVLGINMRNRHIADRNPAAAIRLVNDKYATKLALASLEIPVAPTLAFVTSRVDLARFDFDSLGDAWALKPNHGRAGIGILLARGRVPGGWQLLSGRPLPRRDVHAHVRAIIDGEFSNQREDQALVEPLIVADPRFARLGWKGLPDIRIICDGPRPVLAMARLPTAASGGRANLHQGAVGAGIDLASGELLSCRVGGAATVAHPDSGQLVVGARIPAWDQIISAATRCSRATGLRYLGVDVVIDRDRGPLVLEVNARPGLEIQNVTRTRLGSLVSHGPDRQP